ncbi:MAG: lipopolysaccharide heptosyltransferase II [Candidatus Hydrogenedentes bacterium]|nr:lipopolysaccharide heptosyltransferase II [Candidatus Hydrogenedentota bacterium]
MIDSPRRILALIPNWLGDAAMCTPALRTLHQRFPEAELTVAGRAPCCALLGGLPFISRFHDFPARPGPVRMLSIGRALRPYARDLTVVFPHSLRAAAIARLTGSRRILAYARNARRWLLTDPVEPNREDGKISPVYMVWEYLDLLEGLGVEYDGFGLQLEADPMAVARIKEHLVGKGPFVGIAPGAAYGPSKRWAVERFAEVADRLAEEAGAQCVLLTGPGEEDTRDAILEAARQPLLVCDEGRPTVDTLKATVSLLQLMVCNDSGPRHVATGFNVPAVCIMGPTKPVYSEGPYEKGRVLRVDVDCGPCQKPTCKTDHRCMTRITPDAVIDAALAYLPKARV